MPTWRTSFEDNTTQPNSPCRATECAPFQQKALRYNRDSPLDGVSKALSAPDQRTDLPGILLLQESLELGQLHIPVTHSDASSRAFTGWLGRLLLDSCTGCVLEMRKRNAEDLAFPRRSCHVSRRSLSHTIRIPLEVSHPGCCLVPRPVP